MSSQSYVADLHAKTSLRPSRQAIKRTALALAVALGVAAAAGLGYGYFATGRYLESTDDAYVKADSTTSRRRCPATSRRCWSPTTSR